MLEHEVKQVFEAFSAIGDNYKPQVAFIIVNKKINQRFFLQTNNNNRPYENPPSGSIVADKITSRNFDFLLASQKVTEGTCTPTHYHVVHNSTNLAEEEFWTLTYY